MWLLDTSTLKLKDFIANEVPQYAILSHTWDAEEVSFQDIDKAESKALKGYKKIERCCALAWSKGFDYAWIDTCCIDKKSSAELSEAINSMYNWYAKSGVCFVYLSDFNIISREELNDSEVTLQFRRSRWFTRGWCLQELLAPNRMEFYTSNWGFIDNKSGLRFQLSVATGIPIRFIQDGELIAEASVAARMSWASTRETTRLEDEAYSLMGIFDVNMPLLYGEGRKAFLRLQHEIARSLDDESLFAWHTEDLQSGIFAPNTRAFEGCGAIRSLEVPNKHRVTPRQAATITNRGLHLEVFPRRLPFSSLHGSRSLLGDAHEYEYSLLPLNCARMGSEAKPFTIILRRISHNQYIRFLPGECMVYEKYFPNDTLERDRQKDKDYHHMIFLRDPPRPRISWMTIHRLTVDQVKPNPLMRNRSSYRLKEWYLSPLAMIIMNPMDDAWSIRFRGWSGFALLKFEDWRHEKSPFIIRCRNVHTEEAKRVVQLGILNGYTGSVADAVDACYKDRDLLRVMSMLPEKQIVLSEAGEIVSLSQHYNDYELSLPVSHEG
ncbi:MAG: hypothetical protein Q9208_006220 [Pyrenodesmia sp. 3 TL-2023]